MTIQLSQVNWVELDERIQQVIKQEYQIIPLPPGLEASVMRIEMEDQWYVLKVWDKDSKPDIAKQYRLLSKALSKWNSCFQTLRLGIRRARESSAVNEL